MHVIAVEETTIITDQVKVLVRRISMTRKLAYKLVHIIISIFAVAIVFVSMPFCVFTVGAAYHIGGWEPLLWSLQSLGVALLCSSVLVLAFPYFLKKACKKTVSSTARSRLKQRAYVIVQRLNIVSWLGLIVLACCTFAGEYGLWQYDSYHDRHFSNRVIDYHFFPSITGLWGIYLILVAYCSCLAVFFVTQAKNKSESLKVACIRLLFFLPVAAYYSLIWVHRFIPQPRFIG